jgi:hypothetical protein
VTRAATAHFTGATDMSASSKKIWIRLGIGGLVAAASVAALVALAIALTFVSSQSSANRQFQRETGKPCGFCHVPGNEPELGPEGKRFQACGYKFCAPPRPAAGGCRSGLMPCGAWCDRYSEDPHACKYTNKKSCIGLYNNLTHCVTSQPPN